MTYPESRTVDVVDTLWGTAVADPYRWLEDDRDPEVMEWVSAQARTARTYLDGLPEREALRERCEALFNHPRVGIPRRIGEKVFLTRNNGLQNQRHLRSRRRRGRGTRLFGPQRVERRRDGDRQLVWCFPTAATWWRFAMPLARTGKKCACSTWRREKPPARCWSG